VEWPSFDFPAVLPAKWIFQAMEYFKERIENAVFLIFTDDKQYAQDIFLGREDVVLVKNKNALDDFLVMSLCNFGILSSSTFSWWAANFSRKENSQKMNYEFVAPNFWAGHAVNKWFPPNFHSQWITYLPVNK
jgi:hypothetical protein